MGCTASTRGEVAGAQAALARKHLLGLLAKLEPCLVGMEACGSAHHWAREIEKLGHTVKLMSPQFVKPYRKGNKNDPNDAEAICEAVTRPSMRFVPIKSAAQQDLQALHRVREQLLKSRTALVNQVRGLLGEHGIVAPRGIAHLRRLLVEILADPEAQWTERAVWRNPGRDCRAPALLRRTHPDLRSADRASVCSTTSAVSDWPRSKEWARWWRPRWWPRWQCQRIQERAGTLGVAGVGAASALQRQS